MSQNSLVYVECIFDEGSQKSSIAKVPAFFKLSEATRYLLDKYKKTDDPEASLFTFRVPKEGGGYYSPSDTSIEISALAKNVC